jgi:hypothetical protein
MTDTELERDPTAETTRKINLRPPQQYLDAFYQAARQIYRSQANETARREAIMITNCENKPVLFKGETEEQAWAYTKLPWRSDKQPWGLPDDDDEEEATA